MSVRLFAIAAALCGLFSTGSAFAANTPPAASPPKVYDGLTLEQVGTILTGLGFVATPQKTDAGTRYWGVSNNAGSFYFSAGVIGCNGKTICPGLVLFAVDTQTRPTLSELNDLNASVGLVRFYLNMSRSAIIMSEHLVSGGTTQANLEQAIEMHLKAMSLYAKSRSEGQMTSLDMAPDAAFTSGGDTHEYLNAFGESLAGNKQLVFTTAPTAADVASVLKTSK